ncbi:MAG: AbrB/MazE/SpoVT family DNA-binding domain-containing protein, partial [Candidatus Sulfotelmatobacter sp.]
LVNAKNYKLPGFLLAGNAASLQDEPFDAGGDELGVNDLEHERSEGIGISTFPRKIVPRGSESGCDSDHASLCERQRVVPDLLGVPGCHVMMYMTFVAVMSFPGGRVMLPEARMKVNENGRVVIPAPFRKALGIKAGDEVVLRVEDDELRITTIKRRIERAQRLIRKHVKPGTSLVDELIAERREAARNG